MAENDTEDNAEENAPEEVIPPRRVVTHVTGPQWWAMGILGILVFIAFVIMPGKVSEKSSLKDAGVYVQFGREKFQSAHQQHSFPKSVRLNTYSEVVWYYETAKRAGGILNRDDFFRWGMSCYHLAVGRYENSPLAFIQPLRLFTEALLIRNDKESETSDEKLEYLLGQAYLKIGNSAKALPYFETLREKKRQLQNHIRRQSQGFSSDISWLKLGASPYLIQQKELYQSDLLLGDAYLQRGQLEEASVVLRDYIEAVRSKGLHGLNVEAPIEPDTDTKYKALSMLGTIYWKLSRDDFVALKGVLALSAPKADIEKARTLLDRRLELGRKYLEEIFQPEYQVFDLSKERLKLAEIAYRQRDFTRTVELARGYKNRDRNLQAEMQLWNILALLSVNSKEPVAPVLNTIAADPLERATRLGALVILGDSLVAIDEGDRALGDLVPQKGKKKFGRDYGVYPRAAEDFDEKEFELNPFIDKLTLVNHMMKRALEARQTDDEETAIRLYLFLLKTFSIPKAKTVHEIGDLMRTLARKSLEDGKLGEKARELYRKSALRYLQAQEEDYDEEARKNMFFEAAESYFEGHFYFNAYENYQKFIASRPSDARISQAFHRMGISALHRKNENRFAHAKSAFMQNISPQARRLIVELEGMGVSDEKLEIQLNKDLTSILRKVNTSSRNIWSYQSYLALGDAYYEQHDYTSAKLVYKGIMTDPRFDPSAEVWRKAAYQLARLSFDESSESRKRVKPWGETIGRLYEVLMRYDIDFLKGVGSAGEKQLFFDENLRDEMRRENADIKYLLALAHLNKGDATTAEQHARQLVEDARQFSMEKAETMKANALLGDTLFKLERFKEALEYFRRAHDKNLESYERPFYSLNMADCLIALEGAARQEGNSLEADRYLREARGQLQRTRWEFEKLFEDPQGILKSEDGKVAMDRDYWMGFVDEKLSRLGG
ncbi:MAG: tetratricopeptide repeat protein [Planctomycetes bacterium]|nr:tetratricopeptide repeat protein [Planctomycetota bacterium]